MRLNYVPDPPPTPDAATASIVDAIRARRHPRPLIALDLTLLHSPPVAAGWNSLLGAVRTQTSLPASLRELAICRVAVMNHAGFEWAAHAPILRGEGGMSEEGIAIVRDVHTNGDDAKAKDILTEEQKAVLDYATRMTRDVIVDDRTFDRLRTLFSEQEIVELTATIAAYNCVSRFLVALDVGEKNNEPIVN